MSWWASWMGRGMYWGVSRQANPIIIPWSPAPCFLPAFSSPSTPIAMSGDCGSTATSTLQPSASKPILASV